MSEVSEQSEIGLILTVVCIKNWSFPNPLVLPQPVITPLAFRTALLFPCVGKQIGFISFVNVTGSDNFISAISCSQRVSSPL